MLQIGTEVAPHDTEPAGCLKKRPFSFLENQNGDHQYSMNLVSRDMSDQHSMFSVAEKRTKARSINPRYS